MSASKWHVADRETGRIIEAGLSKRQAEGLAYEDEYLVAVRGNPEPPTTSDAADWDQWRQIQGYSGCHQ